MIRFDKVMSSELYENTSVSILEGLSVWTLTRKLGPPMLVGMMTAIAIIVPLSVVVAESELPKAEKRDVERSVAPQTAADGTPTEKSEAYISVNILGSLPANRSLKLNGDDFPGTTIGGGLGGGIKAGVYPAFLSGVVGIEGEIFGHNGDIVAPQTTVGGVTRSANATLNVVNAMANLLLRYPHEIIQPYVGVGVGVSGGFLRGANLQNSQQGIFTDNAGDAAFAYQFLGGVRVNMGDRFFLFSEYKYFLANYKWLSDQVMGGPPGGTASLEFRTHIISGGIGIRF